MTLRLHLGHGLSFVIFTIGITDSSERFHRGLINGISLVEISTCPLKRQEYYADLDRDRVLLTVSSIEPFFQIAPLPPLGIGLVKTK